MRDLRRAAPGCNGSWLGGEAEGGYFLTTQQAARCPADALDNTCKLHLAEKSSRSGGAELRPQPQLHETSKSCTQVFRSNSAEDQDSRGLSDGPQITLQGITAPRPCKEQKSDKVSSCVFTPSCRDPDTATSLQEQQGTISMCLHSCL